MDPRRFERRHDERNDETGDRGLRRCLVSLRSRRLADLGGAAGPDRPHRRGHLGAGVAARVGERCTSGSHGHREHAEELRAQVAPNLFAHLDVEGFPSSTLDALALANRAYRTDFEVGERVSFALRDALFEEGQDISDPVTLEDLAHDLGIVMPDEADRVDVVADWHEGERRGVLGSPHFFCGDTDVFCPSLDITKDPAEGVMIVKDVSRLTEFLERCLTRPGPA